MEDLWKIRQRKRMTIAQLSSQSGVPVERLREYEAGREDIRTDDLPRLARALYVEEWEIRLRSDPVPPQAATQEPAGGAKRKLEERPQRGAKPRKPPQSPAAARPSQITHLQALLPRLALTQAEVETMIGKPLAELTRLEASGLLDELQRRIVAGQSVKDKEKGKRRRPYLPEAVDEFEFRYLTAQQEAARPIEFTLFNGQRLCGRIVGFSPYAITIGLEEGAGEVTMQKLSIAYYHLLGDGEEASP